MEVERLRRILESYRRGEIPWQRVLVELQQEMARQVVGVRSDPLRGERIGFPEVVLGRGKTVDQLRQAVRELSPRVVVSRLDEDQMERFAEWSGGELELDRISRIAYHRSIGGRKSSEQAVLILTGGTADLAVAGECEICLRACGINAEVVADVGVAGPHRLGPVVELLSKASAVVVVAGMEASLATLVASLTPAPVIAVPSSGQGATPLGGIESLVSMVSSCVPGLMVVGIDSGVSAAAAVVRVLGLAGKKE